MTLRKRLSITLLASVLGTACQSLRPPPPPPKPVERTDVAPVVSGDRAFAMKLLRELRERGGNFTVSPAGLRMSLCMLWAGAQGETEGELAEALGLGGDPAAIHLANSDLRRAWLEPPKGLATEVFRVRIAHGFFAQTELQAGQAFTELLAKHYGAPFSPKDFQGAADTARDQINRWVEDRTDSHVAELIASGGLETGMGLVLVSAFDFETPWQEPFDPKLSFTGKFTRKDGKAVDAKFMTRSATLEFTETPDVQLVEIPFAGDSMVLDVLVPRKDLADLEAKLDEKELSHLLAALAPEKVRLTLPRFAGSPAIELGDLLKKLGIHAAFERTRADFSKMNGKRGGALSRVPHQVSFRITETETTDLKADAAKAAPKEAEGKGWAVRADRAFLYLIRDRRRSALLALGRLSDPTPR
ncbi:MAG: serpin family protein [Polyangiaceae bacterium]